MKIQRDNSNVALTQEMKDEVFKKEQEKIKEAERQLEAKIKKDKLLAELREEEYVARKEFESVVMPVGKRQAAYPPILEQLDMLWHDMDTGAIKVDKRKKDTWYAKIKEIKEATPLDKTWREDTENAQKKMAQVHKQVANTNLHGV